MALASRIAATSTMQLRRALQPGQASSCLRSSAAIISTNPGQRLSVLQRSASFLHEPAVPPKSRNQDTNRVVYNAATQFVRTKQKGTVKQQSPISTLATESQHDDVNSENDLTSTVLRDEEPKPKPSRTLTRAQRRAWLAVAIIVSFPFLGDILDVVLPGLLGTFIYVAGGIKRGVQFVRGEHKKS